MAGMKRHLQNQDGAALLITLCVITVLLSVTMELSRKVRHSVDIAAGRRDLVTLSMMAESGLAAAKGILAKDKKETRIDSVQEDWADPDKVREIVSAMPFEAGELEVTITDESGKISVNALLAEHPGNGFNNTQRKLWLRLFGLIVSRDKSEDDRDPEGIVNAMKDWMDSRDDDAVTGISGAESEYYEDLNPPYSCKNGPMDTVSELFLIKGAGRDLFAFAKDESLEIEGLKDASPGDFITVFGAEGKKDSERYTFPGKININTAPAAVIAAILPEGDEANAQAVVDYRAEKEDDSFVNSLSGTDWVKNVPGLSDVKLSSELVTDKSDLFSVRSEARMGDETFVLVAVMKRTRDKEGRTQVDLLRQWHEL